MLKQIIRKTVYFILSPFLKLTGPRHSVYLTFDDGPHQTNTPKTLQILKDYNAAATFFFNGDLIDKYPEVVAEVQKQGHQIGYHSYVHQSLKQRTLGDIYTDLKTGKKILRNLGADEFLYRPPYGDLSITALLVLILGGWKIVMWDIESRDSFDSEQQIIKNLDMNQLSHGSVILMHDVYEKTTNVLPVILSNLIDSGFKPRKLTYK